MYDVVNLGPDMTTGSAYKLEGYDLIGKTGTAQYVNSHTGKYYEELIIIFVVLLVYFLKIIRSNYLYCYKRPSYGKTQAVVNATKAIVKDVAKYLNIFPQITNKYDDNFIMYEMPHLINTNITDALRILSEYNSEVIVIGNGDKVINQYPYRSINVSNKDKVFIVTNNYNIIMPNIKGWSSRDVLTFCNLINLECELNGYGYVYNQNIAKNTFINKEDKLIVDLQRKIE